MYVYIYTCVCMCMSGATQTMQLLNPFYYFICIIILAKQQVDRKQAYTLLLMANSRAGTDKNHKEWEIKQIGLEVPQHLFKCPLHKSTFYIYTHSTDIHKKLYLPR